MADAGDIKPANEPVTIKVRTISGDDIKFKVRKQIARNFARAPSLTQVSIRCSRMLQVKKSTKFSKVFEAYLAQTGEDPAKLNFLFDGEY
jgi:hypothetical protein